MSAVDAQGRTIWIIAAHCGDGKRFVVRADDKLTAFLELEAAVHRQREVGVKYWEIVADNLKRGPVENRRLSECRAM